VYFNQPKQFNNPDMRTISILPKASAFATSLILTISLIVGSYLPSWGQTTVTFTASGPWTVPAYTGTIVVEAWGGGGAGGGSTNPGGLFQGRGGAGGGGGAYAIQFFTPTVGTIWNLTVAGTTVGTSGANGTTGGFSTITGLEASIYANGGVGGTGNTAGGSPAGGAGGTWVGFVGTNGGNGTNGATGFGASSGDGGYGANGGFGGAGFATGTGPGNPGSAFGGAGSGARTASGGASQAGGTGAAGYMRITYTPSSCFTTLTLAGGSGSPNQQLCVGEAITDIVWNVGGGATGVTIPALPAGLSFTYNTGVLTISGTPSVGPGSFPYTITTINGSGCVDATESGVIFIEPTPVAGTLAPTPAAGTVCDITSVSATLTAGSGGNGTDELEYSLSGGAWSPYISGTGIATLGETSVSIRTRRLGTECASSGYNTVTWTVEATPIAGVLVPSAASPVCQGTGVSATLTPGSGGSGTDELEYQTNGGGYVAYTSGTTIPTAGLTSVDIRTRRLGTACANSAYTTVSWTVEVTPVAGTLAPTPAAGLVCDITSVSAALTSGSGGNGIEELEISLSGGAYAAYISGTPVATAGQTSVSIRTRMMAAVCAPSAYNTVTWTVEVTPTAGTLAPTPAAGLVCDITSVSAVLTAGTGGNGTDELEVSLSGGAYAAYTSGTSVPTLGQTSVTIRTRRMATACSPSGYNTVTWTVEVTPVAGTLTPNTTSPTCEGTGVSATLTPGSGGNGTDELDYRTNGGGWLVYTSGTNIPTAGLTSVDIRTRRMAAVCSPSSYNTVSWVIEATPVSGTLTKIPNVASVACGVPVSATLAAGSGGNGTDITEYRTFPFPAGPWTAWTTYTPGSPISTVNVTGVEVQTYREADYCSDAAPNTVSWTVATPTAQITAGSTSICQGTTTNITVTLTGTAPWNLMISDGIISFPQLGIPASPYIFSVSPAVSKTYTITSVNDANCIGTVIASSAVIDVNTPPVFSVCPANFNIDLATGVCSQVVSYTATATSAGLYPIVYTYTMTGATVNPGGIIPDAGTGSGTTFNRGTTTVTVYASNGCVPVATCSFTVKINDITAPDATALVSSTIVNCAVDAILPTWPTANDDCDGVITGVPVGSSTTCTKKEYYFTFTDVSGNVTNWTFTYNFSHAGTSPTESGSAATSATVECPANAVAPTLPVILDYCGNVVPAPVPVITQLPNPVTCEGTITYTYNYVDCIGLPFTWVFTYTIDHTIAPSEFGGPAVSSSTVQCVANAVAPTLPVIQDVCGNVLTPVGAPTMGGTYAGCEGTYTYTYDYVDCSGLPFSWTYTYTIDRTTAPAEVGGPVPTSSTVQCVAAAVAPTLPVVHDVCGAVLTPAAPTIGGTYAGCEGTYTYTYVYTDCSGLTFTWVYTYTIDITTPPAEVGGPVSTGSTIQCVAAAASPALPVVHDVCGNVLSPALPTIGGTYAGCEGTYTYTYVYTDCSGLTFTWVYTYTIDITTPPAEVGGPVSTGSTIECSISAIAPTLPVVQDVCGNLLTPAGPTIGGTYAGCEGTITYTYVYTDCSGLTFTWVYTYTVDRTTAPAEVGGPVSTGTTIQCIAAAVPPSTLPVVQDVCGAVLTPTGFTTGGTYAGCEGTFTYTYHYVDCSGLTYDWTYTYTIDITTPPAEVGGPVTIASTVECVAAAVAPTLPVVQDVCGNVLTPAAPVMGGTYAGCEGTYTYTYIYTDCSGLTFPWTYTYTIDRVTIPAEVGGPVATSSTVQCVAAAVAPALPVVHDVCGAVLTPSAATMGGTYMGCEGTYTYTYNYVDCSGLTYTWTYTYTIDITTPPAEVGGPAVTSLTVDCPADAVPPVLPVVQDVCGNVLTPAAPTIVDVPASLTCEGSRTYTYVYTDCSGLTFTWVYTYTVEYEDFTMPANANIVIECINLAYQPIPPTVYDNCGVLLTPSIPVYNSTPFNGCEGYVTYTWTYTDCEGNSHDYEHKWTIDRSGPQEIGGPVAIASTVNCYVNATAPTTLPVIEDDCGVILIPAGPVVGGTYNGCEGTVTYTYTYTDCAANVLTWVYTYTVDMPAFPDPADASSTVACAVQAIVPTPPVIFDQCGVQIIPTGPVTTGTYAGCEGTIIYTWVYTDCAGATQDWAYTYTVEVLDFTMPANTGITVDCPDDTDVQPTPPVVTDYCGNTITPSGPVVSAKPTCEGTRTYTWTYTDCEGNSHNWVYTYTVEYEPFTIPVATAPVTGLPAASFYQVISCPASAIQPAIPTILDNCGNVLAPTSPFAVLNEDMNVIGEPYGCEGWVSYTWTFVDCEGNSQDYTHMWVIERNDFTMPSNGTATVTCSNLITVPTPPVVVSDCGDPITPTFVGVTATPACNGTVVYTWNYADCEGNNHDWTFTYTINDNIAPVATAVTSFTVYLDNSGAASITAMDIDNGSTDNCINPLTYSVDVTSFDCSDLGSNPVVLTVTDCAGNSSTAASIVMVVDNINPSITPILTTSYNTNAGVCNFTVSGTALDPIAADNCGVTLTNSVNGLSTLAGHVFAKGPHSVIWTAIDPSLNTVTWTHNFTVVDAELPVVTLTGAATVTICVTGGPYTELGATATDNCDPVSVVITGTYDLNTVGQYTITYSATDLSGNTGTATRIIDVISCDVSGTVKYNNNAQTPMNNVTVSLYSGLTPVPGKTAVTDANGAYTIPAVTPGTYNVRFSTNKPVGSINATDASLINSWQVQVGPTNPIAIEKVKFLAGDVASPDSVLTSFDAFTVLYYFLTNGVAGWNNPNATPWVWWTAGQTIDSNRWIDDRWPNVTVVGSSVTANFYGMASGDFNGSHVPNLAKTGANIQINDGQSMFVEPNTNVELPMLAGFDMSLGAVSMILDYPSDKVEITGAYLNNDPNMPILFDTKNGIVRLAWTDLNPVQVLSGEPLVTLKLKTSQTLGKNEIIRFTMNQDPLCEFADGSSAVINNALLIVDVLTTSLTDVIETPAEELGMMVYPNPFREQATILVNLPKDGSVTLEIHNLLGQKVSTLINGDMSAGVHRITLNPGTLSSGVYTATLRLEAEGRIETRNIRIVTQE
jgi:hypothetical protein